MYIDDLICSKREFLKELQALCKKYNAKINGCGCCGSPWIEFEDETMDGLYASGDMLYVTTGDRQTVYSANNKHDIEIAEESIYPEKDSNYNYTMYIATCKKCGMSHRSKFEREAREALERKECK